MLRLGLSKVVRPKFVIEKRDSAFCQGVCSGVIVPLQKSVLRKRTAPRRYVPLRIWQIQPECCGFHPSAVLPDFNEDSAVGRPQPVDLPVHFVRVVCRTIHISTGSMEYDYHIVAAQLQYRSQSLSRIGMLSQAEANCGPVAVRVLCRKRTPTLGRRARMEPRRSSTRLTMSSNPNAQERSDDEPTDKQRCPDCGGPIRGIERTGVTGNATVVPCGHDIGGITVRELTTTRPQYATDGGTADLAGDAGMTADQSSSDEEHPACPHCDTLSLTRRAPSSGGPKPENEYYCRRCATGVDDPNWRPRKADRRSSPEGTTARALEDADPSELATDGSGIDPLVCPRGHHSIKMNAERFRCETCRRQGRDQLSWEKSELVDLTEQDPPLTDNDPDQLATDGGTNYEDSPMTTETTNDDQQRKHHLRFAAMVLATAGILLMDNTATVFALPAMFLAGYEGANWQATRRGEVSE